MPYIRFEARRTGESMFSLLDRWRLDEMPLPVPRRHRDEFECVRDWLFGHTPGALGSAYRAEGLPSRPRTWWRSTAEEHVAKAWRLCHLANLSGLPLRPIRAAKCPGVLIYRDQCQAVISADPAWVRRALRPPKRGSRRGRGWSGDRTTIRRWDWDVPPAAMPHARRHRFERPASPGA